MNLSIFLFVLTEKSSGRYNPKVFRQQNRLAHA